MTQDAAPITHWQDALGFAIAHHGHDVRKRTRIPYVTHVIAVAETLAYHYPDRDHLVVAGLLHDVVEDTHATFESIEARFGAVVEDLVRAVSKDDTAMDAAIGQSVATLTEGKTETEARAIIWRERRKFMLSHLQPGHRDEAGHRDVLRLKAADAHANLGAILRDLRNPAVGEGVWGRFKVGREDSLWFYEQIAGAVAVGLPGEPLAEALAEVLAEVRST